MEAKPTVDHSADDDYGDYDDDIVKVRFKQWSNLFTARYGKLN